MLTILIGLFLVLQAFWGFKRGAVRRLAAMLSLVVSVILVSAVLPYVTGFLKESTPVYTMIESQVDAALADTFAEVENSANTIAKSAQMEIIDNLPLPESVKDTITSYNNSEGYKALSVSTFQEYVVAQVATLILNVAAFLFSVLLVNVFLRTALLLLDVVARLPGLNFINRVAGAGIGLVQGVLYVWIFFLVVAMLQGTDAGASLAGMIEGSTALKVLYDANVFLWVVGL